MKVMEKISGLGIITAIAASLCCITPVLAAFAGISGLASTFSWLEPARPYFISATVLVLGFAWYQKLKKVKDDQIDCDCETDAAKPSFMQSNKFLGIVTIAAGMLLAFPSYSYMFFPEVENTVVISDPENVYNVEFYIDGMTCTGCEHHIENAVSKLEGIMTVTASYQDANAKVAFDKSQTSLESVVEAINSTGYEVKDIKEDELH